MLYCERQHISVYLYLIKHHLTDSLLVALEREHTAAETFDAQALSSAAHNFKIINNALLSLCHTFSFPALAKGLSNIAKSACSNTIEHAKCPE